MNPNHLNITMNIIERYLDLFEELTNPDSVYYIYKSNEDITKLRSKAKRNFSVLSMFCNKGYTLNKKSSSKSKLSDTEIMEALISVQRDINREIRVLENDLRDMNTSLTGTQYRELRERLRGKISDFQIEVHVVEELRSKIYSDTN